MKKYIFILLAGLLLAQPGMAQNIVEGPTTQNVLTTFISAVLVLAIVVLITLIAVLAKLTFLLKGEKETATEKLTFWQWVGGLKPLSKEKDLLLHEDYDGIQELDNPTPVWFNALFGFTILFGIAYLLIYHVWDAAPLQEAEYERQVQIAEIQKEEYLKKVAAGIDEKTVKLVSDAKALQKGKQVFIGSCASCHGQVGEGKVGPNLTDEYWLHGGSVNDIFKTIKYGVPAKGMIAWEKQLNPLQMQYVSSYILSLQGTKPANAKEPQGKKVASQKVNAPKPVAVSN